MRSVSSRGTDCHFRDPFKQDKGSDNKQGSSLGAKEVKAPKPIPLPENPHDDHADTGPNALATPTDHVVLSAEAKKVARVQSRPSSHQLRRSGRKSLTPGLNRLAQKAYHEPKPPQESGHNILLAGLYENWA
ncbi:MAG: hypothetical protein AB7S38_10105 [Vulcanimicrobiota bacterium]